MWTDYSFPRQEVIDEFKQNRWLKDKTKVSVENSFAFKDELNVLLGKGFFARNYNHIVLFYWLNFSLLYLKIIPPHLSMPIMLLNIGMLIWASRDLFLRGSTASYQSMGKIEKSEIFCEFLDKFAVGWDMKIYETEKKIFWGIFRFLKKRNNRRGWLIEYDILLMAGQYCQRDSAGFQEVFKKAKNRKELRWILGIS